MARVAPLDPRPFLRAASLDEGDARAAAEPLLNAALKRNPRMIDARLRLMRLDFESSRIGPAVEHAIILASLRPDLAIQFDALLVEAAREPGARRHISRRLANRPQLVRMLASPMSGALTPPEMLELIRFTDLEEMPGATAQVQRAVTRAYLAERDYDRAFAVWRRVLGERPENAVHDGSFSGSDAAPPFTWTIVSDTSIEARPIGAEEGQTALRVRAFGDLPSAAAHQHVVLEPGRHVLRYRARQPIAPPDRSSGFRWLVRCTSSQVLAEEAIPPPGPNWADRTVAFQVPQDCPAQILTLQSIGGLPDGESEIFVTRVRIDG